MPRQRWLARHTRTTRVSLVVIMILLLGSLTFLYSHSQAKAAGAGITTLLIHGYGANGPAVHCDDYFSTIKSTFAIGTLWQGTPITVGFYQGDTCNTNLYDYDSGNHDTHCDNYHNTYDAGTLGEEIEHIGCRLAWYIYYGYSQFGAPVDIVGYSLGGLIVRWALGSVGHDPAFPPSLLVLNVATLGTPHKGVPSNTFGIDSHQVDEMKNDGTDGTGTALLDALQTTQYQDPHGGASTHWLLIGGNAFANGDGVVPAYSSIGMVAEHRVLYSYPQYFHVAPGFTYYDDDAFELDATAQECELCGPGAMPDGNVTTVHSIEQIIDDFILNSPPTATPVPPTATPTHTATPTPLPPTATPMPPGPAPCSASLNPHWVYENSNTSAPLTYSGLHNLGHTYTMKVSVHVELQSLVDFANSFCGQMRTITTVSNASGSCTDSWCDLYGDAGATTHYKNNSGTYVDNPTATNSGNVRTGFTTTTVTTAQASLCASGKGYFAPTDETLSGTTLGMGEHCRTAPTCGNATISHPTPQAFNLDGHTGTLEVYLEKGQNFTGSDCVFNGVLIAVGVVNVSNGATTGRITATIYDNQSPPLQHNHTDTNFSAASFANATTTYSESCGHARATLTIDGVSTNIQTSDYCG